MSNQANNPFLTAPEWRKRLTLIGIYIAVVGSIVQTSSLSTLLPVAAGEIGGMEYYSLASTLSGIIGVAVMPLWGYLGAKSPALKRPLFAVSELIGAAVVFARAFAPDMMTLVVPSMFYGFVSAGIFVLGYSMIRDMYDRKKAGTYLGFCGTMMAIGMLLGPTAGGLIMDAASWRWVCHLIWPFFVVGSILVLLGVRVTKEEAAGMASTSRTFDAAGAISMMVFLGTLITGLSLGTSFLPFGSFGSYAVFALCIIAGIALVAIVRKKRDDAIVPLSALKNRNVIRFACSNFLANFSNMAVFFFLPTYVIAVMQLSATEAGLSTTMYSVAGLFLGPVFGRAIGKAGTAKGVLSLSFILRVFVSGSFLLLLAPDTNILLIYVVMLVAGVYSSANGASFSAGPQVQLPEGIRVQGNSVIQVGQNLGGAIGTAVYTVVLGTFGVLGGMPMALAISVIAAVIGLVLALRLQKLADGHDRGER